MFYSITQLLLHDIRINPVADENHLTQIVNSQESHSDSEF